MEELQEDEPKYAGFTRFELELEVPLLPAPPSLLALV